MGSRINTILLTGANGFLGSHLIDHFLAKGFELILLLRTSSDLWRIEHVFSKCTKYYVDKIIDYEIIFRENKIDCVINTATEYGKNALLSQVLQSNVIYPLQLLEFASKNDVKLFLNTDSFFAKKIYNQSYLGNYTFSKRILESILSDFNRNNRALKIVNMRLEHVFGEKDSANKFTTFLEKELLNNVMEIHLTKGEQKRDFIYVQDVVSAYLEVVVHIDSLQSYQEFEVGSGSSITVRKFAEMFAQITGSSSSLKFGALPEREDEIAESKADISGLQGLGWHISTSLESALKRMYSYDKERLKNGH